LTHVGAARDLPLAEFCSKCSRRISFVFLMDFRFLGNFDSALLSRFSPPGVKVQRRRFSVLPSVRSLFSLFDHRWPKVAQTDRFQRRMLIALPEEWVIGFREEC
jgi:hypothetical protein